MGKHRGMPDRVFGEIDGVGEGAMFVDRRALAGGGVHRPLMAGICGSGSDGAESIVLSGGYAEDEDYGTLIIYTGHGGQQAPGSRIQIKDQSFDDSGNAGLVTSELEGLPVRVVRGAGGEPALSPATGYRYDGLYRVVRLNWSERFDDGFVRCRYKLRKLSEDGTPAQAGPPADVIPGRTGVVTQRIVRSTEVTRRVKRLHANVCQVCGKTLDTPGGAYAEGAHIRPLGRPHDGSDTTDNVLCLCPNDHVRLDQGAIIITEDSGIIDTLTGDRIGELRTVRGHALDTDDLDYHRTLHRVTDH